MSKRSGLNKTDYINLAAIIQKVLATCENDAERKVVSSLATEIAAWQKRERPGGWTSPDRPGGQGGQFGGFDVAQFMRNCGL